jgi:hypothetical protein
MILNKCWSPLFDSCTKRSDIFMPICLKCPGIPLDFVNIMVASGGMNLYDDL